MVVPEAMAVGVPALVSDRVGAKCIIETHPGSGQIVPFDKDAIRQQMLVLIEHRDRIEIASAAARRAAQEYSWAHYCERVTKVIEQIFETSVRLRA